jgi:hypothetical protein
MSPGLVVLPVKVPVIALDPLRVITRVPTVVPVAVTLTAPLLVIIPPLWVMAPPALTVRVPVVTAPSVRASASVYETDEGPVPVVCSVPTLLVPVFKVNEPLPPRASVPFPPVVIIAPLCVTEPFAVRATVPPDATVTPPIPNPLASFSVYETAVGFVAPVCKVVILFPALVRVKAAAPLRVNVPAVITPPEPFTVVLAAFVSATVPVPAFTVPSLYEALLVKDMG